MISYTTPLGVTDPFCGCGTTVAVAHVMKRAWVGIDISPTAIGIMNRRLLKRGANPIIESAPTTVEDLKALGHYEFQNWIINAVFGDHSPKPVGDMGIDGFWFITREPIQVKQQESVDRPELDKFETAIRRAGHTTGYIIAFSFTSGAFEEVTRARNEEGLDIRLLKVAAVMLQVRRPGGKNWGPQPGSVTEMPLPPKRKKKDLPTAAELVASDLTTAVGA